MKYPNLVVDLERIAHNTQVVTTLCRDHKIKVTGVIKGCGGISQVGNTMYDHGCYSVGSSRISQLKALRQQRPDIPTCLVRIAMPSEVEAVIAYADISLQSEKTTLTALNAAARLAGKIHQVILMYDLGDLREGIFDTKTCLEVADYIENDLSHLYLLGLGSNLSCYGSIVPTEDNLGRLVQVAEAIEDRIGRTLDLISGGGTTTLPALLEGQVPERINHLRVGEGILSTLDLPMLWDVHIKGLEADTFVLQAEVVEENIKPTAPIGKRHVNAFGETCDYEDLGDRHRLILALGNQDVGHIDKLVPKDPLIKVVGASSDHMILDVEDCQKAYAVGDILGFNVRYEAMLFSCLSKDVALIIKGE